MTNPLLCEVCDVDMEQEGMWWRVSFDDEDYGEIVFYTCKSCCIAAEELRLRQMRQK